VTTALPIRAATLVTVLTALAIALALAFCPRAGARARTATCPHATTNRSRHGAHSCAGKTGRGHHKSKARMHSNTGGHQRAAGSHTSTSGNGGEGARGGAPSTSEAAGAKGRSSGAPPARCEDGSAPEPVERGENGQEEAFVCEDGSEPLCAAALTPVVSGDGTQLLCEAASGAKQSG
jgi:hypothetical protein